MKVLQVNLAKQAGEETDATKAAQSSYANLEEEMSSGADLVGAPTAHEQSDLADNNLAPSSTAEGVDSIDVEIESGAGTSADGAEPSALLTRI